MLDAQQYREAVSRMENGDVKAKTKVGGVEIDEEGAVAQLEECANNGEGQAKWMLGLCCEYGMGIEQDIERAELLYQQSKEGGNVVGEFLLKNGKDERGSGVMRVNSL